MSSMTKKQAVRERFREAVFARDGHKCRFCDRTELLDAHHITNRKLMPGGGYVVENGITLCAYHHLLAERQDSMESYVDTPYRADHLYELIGSSYTKAFHASQKLNTSD